MLKLDINQRTILEGRYLQRDEKGQVIETPEGMFRRVARAVAAAEARFGADAKTTGVWEERFFELMAGLDFLPNSPTLINAGRELGQLAACFVLPVEDSIEAIFETLKETALIHKSGGGTGFNFSRLRPKGDPVRSTGGVASGPVSFMRIFNAATEEIKQGGVRRGANMGILRVDHPDILEFITCKEEEGAFRNFNLSVAVTDAFFMLLERGEDLPLIFGGRIYNTIPALRVFETIARHAHANGEPGLLFLDAVNRDNPTPVLGHIEATNPCGEQPLLPYEACNLGSINLAQMLSGKGVAWDRLRGVVHDAVRFLDDVVEVNSFPIPEIAAATRRTRKVGLGIMGWADVLFRLGIPYDSAAALELAGEIMSFIREEARAASRALAAERGAFPAWEQSVYYPELPLRNATLTTIAPTGSISGIAGVSPGIEPVFALSYTRTVFDGKKLLVVDRVFLDYLKAYFPEAQREAILNAVYLAGNLQDVDGVPPEAKAVFKTALEIAPEWHLRVQAAFQEHTDNAVSKTINLPQAATVEDVADVFRMAYTLGLKGLTVYRTGSRKDQPLTPPANCRPCRIE
ncbi:MAG: adenosylcobalamin-dependent ribonucleoside-diphosphate reductase [Bacillota bacterium]|jgi:ribonucleoside-diphosphate reductase alpha chain|nr:adenosylcobalamin-dependent ribonucleoside-diphosphate reductase [Thermoanaerobacteraceae bacterium]